MLVRGADALVAKQNEDGSWGGFPHPAVSSLCVLGLHGDTRPAVQAAVGKGLAHVLSFRQADGSIYPAGGDMTQSGNYPNYSTSVALLALATVNRPEDVAAMRAARAFLQSSQFSDQEQVDFGGIGYGKTGRADLSNASWAAEALYLTEYLDVEGRAKEASGKMWRDLQAFLSKCQNASMNGADEVSTDPRDAGGFYYRPGESKAGERTGEYRGMISSGSMTYAGLKSMIYAKVSRQDPRVIGAVDYLRRHYTVAENPEMGMQGYYYYLHTMAKALDVYRIETVQSSAGGHHWRAEVLSALAEKQRKDGLWANENGRFMESMPELATSYALITAKVCLQGASQ